MEVPEGINRRAEGREPTREAVATSERTMHQIQQPFFLSLSFSRCVACACFPAVHTYSLPLAFSSYVKGPCYTTQPYTYVSQLCRHTHYLCIVLKKSATTGHVCRGNLLRQQHRLRFRFRFRFLAPVCVPTMHTGAVKGEPSVQPHQRGDQEGGGGDGRRLSPRGLSHHALELPGS